MFSSTHIPVRLVQEENALASMVVTLSPMVTLVRLVQEENAELPMVVTLSGMVIEIRLSQL